MSQSDGPIGGQGGAGGHPGAPESGQQDETVRHQGDKPADSPGAADPGMGETQEAGDAGLRDADNGQLDNPPETTTDAPTPKEQPDSLPRLTAKQRRFLEAWKANGFSNATEAARKCGIKANSESTLRAKAAAIATHPALIAHREAYWAAGAMDTGELISDLSATARLDPATIGTLYLQVRQCCGLPDAPAGNPPGTGIPPAHTGGESPGVHCYCQCPHPKGEVRRRFDWQRAQSLGVSRHVKHVALDRSGNETAEWHDPTAARALLARIHGLTAEGSSVQVNVTTMTIDELRAIVNG